jgi:hypothetical protein
MALHISFVFICIERPEQIWQLAKIEWQYNMHPIDSLANKK